MKPIIGVYLGWIPPHGQQWEPLYRTVRTEGGYRSEYTKLYAPTIERYPGLKDTLKFYPDPLDLPFALKRRIPLPRADYEWEAGVMNLPYPNTDIFEFIGRTGGQMVADGLSVCPVVTADEDGNFTYESILRAVDGEVRDSLNQTSQFSAVNRDNKLLVVTDDGLVLGELLSPYAHLGNSVFDINIVRIAARENCIGRMTVISFRTSVNLSVAPSFVLEIKEAANV